MRTRISSKGQVVIPQPVRDKLQLRPGDPLETCIDGNRIILTPTRNRTRAPRIRRDSRTGLPVLTVGTKALRLTSKQVAEILAEFP